MLSDIVMGKGQLKSFCHVSIIVKCLSLMTGHLTDKIGLNEMSGQTKKSSVDLIE